MRARRGRPSVGRGIGPAAQTAVGPMRPRVRRAGAGHDASSVPAAAWWRRWLPAMPYAALPDVAPDRPRAARLAVLTRALAAAHCLGGGRVGHGVNVSARPRCGILVPAWLGMKTLAGDDGLPRRASLHDRQVDRRCDLDHQSLVSRVKRSLFSGTRGEHELRGRAKPSQGGANAKRDRPHRPHLLEQGGCTEHCRHQDRYADDNKADPEGSLGCIPDGLDGGDVRYGVRRPANDHPSRRDLDVGSLEKDLFAGHRPILSQGSQRLIRRHKIPAVGTFNGPYSAVRGFGNEPR